MTIIAVVLIAMATLPPAAANPIEPRWQCLVCGSTGMTDVIVNVVLFLPYGVGLAMTRTRPRVAIPLVIATTFAIELLQYRVIVGRDGTLSDVITNSVGGIAGFLVAARWRSWLFANARTSAVLALTVLAAWVTTLSLSATGFQVTAQLDGATVRLAPVISPFPHFKGRILSASLDRAPLADDGVARAPHDWSRGHELEASITTNDRSLGPAPILWIGRGTAEAMSLGHQGPDLYGRVRMRASEWRLVVPSIALPGAFASTGAPARVWARVRRGQASVGVTSPNVSDSVAVELAPTLGWALLVPIGRSVGPRYRWLSALWVSGLLIPVGFWSGQLATSDDQTSSLLGRSLPSVADGARVRRRGHVRLHLLLAATILACAVASLPLVRWATGAAATHWTEWAAVGVGLAAGAWAGITVSRLRPIPHT